MSARRLARQVAEHLRRAVAVYELCGALTPKLWAAAGTSTAMEPANAAGLKITEHDRARLLAAMRDAHHAHVIGRADEVWLRMGDGPELLAGGSLEALAEVDPSIRTGLLVCALDCRTMRTAAAVALQRLADDGEMSWAVAPIPGVHLDRLAAVLLLAQYVEADEPDVDLLAHSLGWNVIGW